MLTKKSHYSESEAAAQLGVPVDQLRALVRSRIQVADEDVSNIPSTLFQPSDLLVLKFLVNAQAYNAPVEPTVAPALAPSC